MALAVLGGLALVLALLQLPVLPPNWSPGIGLALLAWRRGACGWRGPVAVLCVLAWCTVCGAGSWLSGVLPAHCERVPVQLTGRVSGLVEWQRGQGGRQYARFGLLVDELLPAHCGGPRLVQLYWSDAPVLRPGDALNLEARLRVPWGLRNPDGRSAQGGHAVRRLQAVGSVRAGSVAPVTAGRLSSAALHRHRDALAARLRAAVEADAAALLAALLLGDRRGLTEHHWARLRAYGLTHLVVISGMHVSLLASVGWLGGAALARLLALAGCGRHRRLLGPALALFAAVTYAALAGWGLPAQRALLMLLPALLLLRAGRAGGGWRVLLLAVLLLVATQPFALLGASLWLSVGAVALLLWLAAWQRRQGPLVGAVKLHGFMVLAMLPVSLFFFSAAATLGAVVNLVAVPLVTLWTVPLGLLGIVMHAALPTVAARCWSLAAEPLLLLWNGLGYWEGAVVAHSVAQARPVLPVLVSALLAALLLPLPGAFRAWSLAGLLALPLFVPAAERGQGVEVTVFDVGQGTAVLVRDGTHSLLYDTGGGVPGGPSRAETEILPHLRALGIRRLDLLVISHLDADHSAGLGAVREALGVAETWSPGARIPGSQPCRFGAARRLGAHVTVRSLSTVLAGDSDNDGSCVLLVESDGARLLLPGDISRGRERDLVAWWGGELRAAALLLGHHGSATSSGELWLRHVRPRDAIVTAARANRFGHPAPAVTAALQRHDIRAWNTGHQGALRLTPQGSGWHIRPYRHRWRPFWWLRSPGVG